MRSKTVERQLAELGGAPAVSILWSLDNRLPGNTHDPAVLAELRTRAGDGIRRALDGDAAASLVASLDDALDSVDLQHPGHAVAVLVSPSASRVVTLDAPVETRVVVSDRFAIHDVVAALSRHIRARIVVLSRAMTRCVDVDGDSATERLDLGFPVEAVAPTEADTPHRDFPLSEREDAEAAKFVFRAVGRALNEVQKRDQRPLVVVGAERDIAYFDELGEGAEQVVGRVHGNHEREAPAELARLARPVLDVNRRRLEQSAAADVRQAMASHAVAGVADVWVAANGGRGRRLVVEDGYRFPARVVNGGLEATPEGEAGSFDAVDDAVGAVIRDGGDVVAVSAGDLGDLGRIALVTRF